MAAWAAALAGSATGAWSQEVQPKPAREVVRVGADTLLERPFGKKGQDRLPTPTLSEQLDGCLWSTPQVDPFSCVARTSRAAARAYRRHAGVRQWQTDAFTAGSALGLSVVAVGVGHAAKDSLNAWTAVGLLPLIADDLSSPGPRARLYNVAAIALTVTVVRAEALNSALRVTRPMVIAGGGQGESLQQAVRAACDRAALDALDSAVPPTSLKKAAEKLNASLGARCDELTVAARKLNNAATLWSFGGESAARNLAADTAALDDTIARLDRSMRATSKETLSVVLKAPFNLASNLVGGQTAPPEYTGRNLPVFTTTYSFNLARAPDAEVPGAVGAGLETPVGLGAPWRDKVVKLNQLTDDINGAIAAASYFKTENERSVLAVSPGNNPPVTLSTPAKP